MLQNDYAKALARSIKNHKIEIGKVTRQKYIKRDDGKRSLMIRHHRSEYESKIADNLYQKWGARIGEVDHGAMLTELTDYGIEIAKSSMTTSEFITWLEWKLPRTKQPIHHKPISPIHAEQIQLL